MQSDVGIFNYLCPQKQTTDIIYETATNRHYIVVLCHGDGYGGELSLSVGLSVADGA
jgi:hypothetical protein